MHAVFKYPSTARILGAIVAIFPLAVSWYSLLLRVLSFDVL